MASPFNGTKWPVISVLAGIGGTPAGVCVRGTGVRGTDVRGGQATVDIGADVQSIRWERGRASVFDAANPGTCTIRLRNSSGDYDPTNTAGAYYPDFKRGAQVAVQVEKPLGMVYKRFTGTITRIEMDVGLWPTTTITIVDALQQLGRTQLAAEVAQFGGDHSGQRIGNIADRAAWPATARLLDQGQATLSPTTFGRSALELIRQAEVSEFGFLFVDASGNLVFYDRHRAETASRSATVQAALTDTAGPGELGMMELTLSLSDDLIVNDAHATRQPDPSQDPELTGITPGDVPVEQAAQNTTSIGDEGVLSLPTEVGTLLASDAQVLGLLQGIVGLFGTQQVRISEVRVNALRGDLWSVLLPLGLLDRISVRRDYGPNTITGELFIQAMSEEIQVSPSRWDLRFTTSNPPPATHYCIRGQGVRGADVRGW